MRCARRRFLAAQTRAVGPLLLVKLLLPLLSVVVTGCRGEIVYARANLSFAAVTEALTPAHRCAIQLATRFSANGYRTLGVPAALKRRLVAFWDDNQDLVEEEYVHPDYVWRSGDRSSRHVMRYLDLNRYDRVLSRDMATFVGGVLEDWTGTPLKHRVTYGLREYRRGAVLKPHVDRYATHVVSAIVNVKQTVDEDWPLVVWDHRHRMRELFLNGTDDDLALYESASVVHGRPFPLRGDSFVNMFLHFAPAQHWDDVCGRIRKCIPAGAGTKWWIV